MEAKLKKNFSEMSQTFNIEKDPEDQIFMGSLGNLFQDTYTNKVEITLSKEWICLNVLYRLLLIHSGQERVQRKQRFVIYKCLM